MALLNLPVSLRCVSERHSRVNSPRASGLHGITPTRWSRQNGSISRSSSRMSKLYWSCIETNRVQPCKSARRSSLNYRAVYIPCLSPLDRYSVDDSENLLIAKNLFCNGNSGHRLWPSSVEREVDNHLFQFRLCQSILLCSDKVA